MKTEGNPSLNTALFYLLATGWFAQFIYAFIGYGMVPIVMENLKETAFNAGNGTNWADVPAVSDWNYLFKASILLAPGIALLLNIQALKTPNLDNPAGKPSNPPARPEARCWTALGAGILLATFAFIRLTIPSPAEYITPADWQLLTLVNAAGLTAAPLAACRILGIHPRQLLRPRAGAANSPTREEPC